MQLKEQNVVIIGGSSGIGLATAKLVKENGANVTIAGRSEDKLHRASEELGGVQTAVADIASEADVRRLFAGLEQVNHVFVAGASLASGKISDAPLEALQLPIAERVLGAMYAIRYAAPKMSDGSITLVSGLFSSRPVPGMAMAAAAISGIEAMARALALELSPIRVNAIAPGYIDTPLLKAAFADQYESVVKAQAATLPTKRIGTAQETAKAVLFLMTNGFVTGEVLHIDGGGRLV